MAFRKVSLPSLKDYVYAYSHSAPGATGTSSVTVRGYRQPISLRNGTSDFAVFCQVTLEEQYQCVPPLRNVRVIVDAGANIGLSALYFLNRFAHARVYALEPDAENFVAAQANLAGMSPERCRLVRCALWPEYRVVSVSKDGFRDGQHWSRTVSDDVTSSDPVQAFSLRNVMEMCGVDRIDILKMDIEGAENRILAADPHFLSHVRCCAIELHDDAAVSMFQEACRRQNFRYWQCGEVTVALHADEQY